MKCEEVVNIINHTGGDNSLIQIIGITVGAFALLLQSYLQNRSNIKLQKENIKDDIKRKFHAEIEEVLSKASDAALDLASLLRRIYWIEYPSVKNSLDNGLPTNGFRVRMEDFMKAYSDTTRSAIEVISVIEKYEIIHPEIKIFQTAINVALDGMRKHYMKLQEELITFLPVITNDGRVILQPLPPVKKMDDYQKTHDLFQDAISHLSNWLGDFRIEIQNLLLGNLFKNKVPHRKPIGKKWIVVTTEKENVRKLNDYFENETDWGRNKKRAENDAKALLS